MAFYGTVPPFWDPEIPIDMWVASLTHSTDFSSDSDMRHFHLAEEKPEAPMKPLWKARLHIWLSMLPGSEGNIDSFG